MAKITGALLAFSMAAFVVPTTLSLRSSDATADRKISRGVAVLLIILYVSYLYFQLRTHRRMHEMRSQKAVPIPKRHEMPPATVWKALAAAGAMSAAHGRFGASSRQNDELFGWTESDEEEMDPFMSRTTSIATLAIGTTVLAFNTYFLTESIGGVIQNAGVTQSFIGIVLLPILSNDLVAIQSGMLDRMDVAILAALGKGCQTILMVIPCLILISWPMGIDDMNFVFDGFQLSMLFVAFYLVLSTIYNGKSTW